MAQSASGRLANRQHSRRLGIDTTLRVYEAIKREIRATIAFPPGALHLNQ